MNKMYKVLFTKFFISALFVGTFFGLQAQVWTGNVDSDWNNPANWSGNQVPTSGSSVTIPGSASGGNFPIFEGSPVIDYTIQNAGVITFNSFVFNTGTIINYNVGQLVSNNFFVNAGKVVFDNDGYFDNNGIFENYGEFDNAASAVFNNNSSAAFNNYGIFRNFGNLNNNGAFINAGDFHSTHTFNNQGSVTNYANFDNAFGSIYNNNAGSTMHNNDGASFASNGAVNHTSTLQNDGEIILNFGATFTNDGDITNNKHLTNSGQFYNNNTLQNNGTLRNNDAALIENNAVVQNSGTIDNGTCAKIIQQANNTISGTIENNGGLIYVLSGAVNVTGGEFGYEFTDLSQTAPPVPGCRPNVQVSLDEAGVAIVQVTDIDKGAYGNCGALITDRTVTPNTFGVADIGQQVVTLSVTDEFNLTATCDAIVQILEYVAPLAALDDPDVDMTCPDNIVLTTLPGANTATASWTVPTGTSDCSTTPPVGDCSNTPSSFPNTIYMGEYNGSKYFCSQYNVTYLQGRQLASQIGGHLAVINDSAENEYIRSRIMASSAWIGYTDEASEGNYVWEGNQNSSYINWDAGQPNNYGGDEDYTRILQSNGKWTDRNGSVSLEAVIEIPCGGTTNCTDVVLNLTFDNYADETSWDILDANGQNVAWGGGYGNYSNGSSTQKTICLADGCYTFKIYDSYGDGMCCAEGNGSYQLVDANGNNLAAGGQFGYNETTNFCIEGNTGGGSGELLIEQIAGQPNGSEFFAGTSQVAYRATDDCGNEEICLFEVTVEKTPAEITSNCPSNIVIDALPGAESAVATWTTPTGTSNCFSDSGVSVNRIGEGLESGDAFPVGTTYIAYVLQDSCGTVATCNFAVTVNEVPATLALLSCPQDVTGSNPISWTEPTGSTTCFTGNLDIRQIEGTPNGGNFPAGTSQVSYLISDDCGNVEVCTFNVTNDGTGPSSEITISCREDQSITVPAGAGGSTVTLEAATASTTCTDGIVNVTQTGGPTTSTFLPLGVTTLTYEATDNCGNIATCSYQITITEEPQGTGDLTIFCPGDQIGRAAVGEQFTIVNWTDPTASTTCSTSSDVVVTQTDGLPNGSEFPVGTSMVTFQATDNCGNVETCTFKIMVTNEACDIASTVSNVLCDDNGTPNDPSDDTFTFDLTVTGVGNPWGWTGGGQTVEYDVVTEFGPYDISDGTVSFAVTDTDNPTCTTNVAVDAPAPCSIVPNVCNNDLLFVVGNTSLNNGDATVKARLENLNFDITVIDDNVVQTSDADGRGLVVISSTVNSGNVGAKFRDVNVPVMTWEAWLYDDMKMTNTGTNTSYGNHQHDSRTVMNEEDHPIAAGLTSLVDVFTANKGINWGRPSDGANIISCLSGDETKVMVFAYEAGKTMVGLAAPARRVGFFLRNATPQCLTTAGWAMFDAAILWSAGCTPENQQLVSQTTDIFEFVVNKEDKRAGLYWINNTGTINDLYTIEKSVDGINFEAIAELDAYQDDNRAASFTQYDEQLVDGKNYYRVKLDYLDGSSVYSEISVVDFSQTADFTVFPNPAADYTELDVKAFMGQDVNVMIYNQMGQLVAQNNLGELNQPFVRLDLTNLQNGVHTIYVATKGRKVAKKLLVTRTF